MASYLVQNAAESLSSVFIDQNCRPTLNSESDVLAVYPSTVLKFKSLHTRWARVSTAYADVGCVVPLDVRERPDSALLCACRG